MDSGGMMRVISATPRPPIVEGASSDDVPAVEIGKFDHCLNLRVFFHISLYESIYVQCISKKKNCNGRLWELLV